MKIFVVKFGDFRDNALKILDGCLVIVRLAVDIAFPKIITMEVNFFKHLVTNKNKFIKFF